MRDLICDVASCSVWSCGTGKIDVYDKIVTENRKIREIMERKENFYTNLYLKDGLEMEFTAC